MASKRRTNVTQACNNCRFRKRKCDGQSPCGTCSALQDECDWGDRTDFRRPYSRPQINQLRARIAALERQLQIQGGGEIAGNRDPQYTSPTPAEFSSNGDMGDWSGPAGSSARATLSDESQWHVPQPSDSTSPLDRIARRASRDGSLDIDSGDVPLVADAHGSLSLHGPSSAYRHSSMHHRMFGAPPSPARAPTSDDQFARFLPDFALTRAQHDLALDRMCRYFTNWAMRLIPHLFYRDMAVAVQTTDVSSLPVLTPNYSPMLHNAVLSLALALSDEPHLRSMSTRRIYLEAARQRIDVECSKPSLATVQALTFVSSFFSTMGDYTLGWTYFGMANRTAQTLGLHVDIDGLVRKGRISRDHAEQRRIAFWSVFTQEELWAVYIGGQPLMPEYTIALPRPDPVVDEIPWIWPDGGPFAGRSQPSLLSSTFVETVRLVRMTSAITNTVYDLRSDKAVLLSGGVVARFGDSLDEWLRDLPSGLVLTEAHTFPLLPHISLLHMAWAWTIILLFRPFCQRRPAVPGPPRDQPNTKMDSLNLLNRCVAAADQILVLAQKWDAQHGLRFTPITMPQIIYTAGTTFLLAAIQGHGTLDYEANIQKVQQCRAALRTIGQTWPAAEDKGTILGDLLTSYGVLQTSALADGHSMDPAAAAAQTVLAANATQMDMSLGDSASLGAGFSPFVGHVPMEDEVSAFDRFMETICNQIGPVQSTEPLDINDLLQQFQCSP